MKIFQYDLLGSTGVLLVAAENENDATILAKSDSSYYKQWDFNEERTDIQYIGDAKVATVILEINHGMF